MFKSFYVLHHCCYSPLAGFLPGCGRREELKDAMVLEVL